MSLSFTQINASLCTPTGTPYSLRAMSAAAGFSTPDAVSEFIGYVCPIICYIFVIYNLYNKFPSSSPYYCKNYFINNFAEFGNCWAIKACG